jgi:hypothetical protein
MRYCTRCGEAARPEQAFCVRCGAPFGQPARTSPVPADSVSIGAEPPPLAPSRSQPTAEGMRPAPVSNWQRPPTRNRSEAASGHFQAPGNERRGRVGAIIVIAAAVLVLGGAFVGWRLLGHTTTHRAASGHGATRTARPGSTGTSTVSPVASPSPSSDDTVQDSNPGAVAMTPVVSQQASAPRVATFLGRYFRAINTHDYAVYSSLFVPEMRSSFQNFDTGYRSTSDSHAVLTGISPIPGGLAAAVSFISHQQPVDSPTGTACTSWDITLYLEPHGGTYWIMHAPPSYHAHYQAC